MSFPYSNFEVPFNTASTEPTQRLEDRVEGVRRSLYQPRTPLLEAFFRIENMDVIQNRLRATIQKQTGYMIDRQSDEHLTTIMRKVYLDHASNTMTEVDKEVRRLNDIVLSITVPMVASGVAGYLAYLRDASRLPEPMPRGVQTSVKGTRSLELFRGL